jgi:dipeptidyl aminopeptidase/acylaminoacyl peptidase
MALTSDIGPSWSRAEYGGWPWERAASYTERSPVAHAARVRTPVLLFHGEADLRVPISQSEAFLTAVTAHGGTVELLRVPGEGHALPGDASPIHARATREAIMDWLERWMG